MWGEGGEVGVGLRVSRMAFRERPCSIARHAMEKGEKSKLLKTLFTRSDKDAWKMHLVLWNQREEGETEWLYRHMTFHVTLALFHRPFPNANQKKKKD